MKFGIDMGHNAPPDTGASSRFGSEDQLTKAIGNILLDKLQALGHEVINCTPSSASSVIDSLRKRVATANSQKVDIYVSIHFNAFNGNANGTEIFAISDAARRIASPVLKNIVDLGFVNRKVKNGSHLYVLKFTSMPAILVECCFIDSEKDMKRYNTEVMANAIIKGLAGKLPDEKPDEPKTQERQTLELQEALNRLQIRDSQGKALKEDGIPGVGTESATQKFNQLMGINASGRPVALTWNAIDEILSQPILRPNHAEGLAVRYVEYRVGSEIDGVYDAKTVEAVKNYQRQQGLMVDGIIGPQSWEKIFGQPKPHLAVEIIRDTVLKQEPIDSTQITDPNQKYPIKEGEKLALHSWSEEGNHVRIALSHETFNGFNTWYAFVDHIEILQDGEPLQEEPEEEAPQLRDRGDAFNLPGYTSTFYLNDPIIPNGNFFWWEAINNGERIPRSKAHVDNIVAVATRLEEVRERLGGFPITVTTWYRPEPWNSEAGGSRNSRHLTGQAVELLRSGLTGRQMAARLRNWPGGMGLYPHYPNLLYLDIRPHRARWGGA